MGFWRGGCLFRPPTLFLGFYQRFQKFLSKVLVVSLVFLRFFGV